MQKHFHTPAKHGHMLTASEHRIRLAFVVLWDSLWNITQMPGSCIGALLPSLLQPLWFHVPSWYETDGEGCTPLMPLCKGWCFRCDFATCGHWQRHTHSTLALIHIISAGHRKINRHVQRRIRIVRFAA